MMEKAGLVTHMGKVKMRTENLKERLFRRPRRRRGNNETDLKK